MKQYIAQLPFTGFYETIHGDKIDCDIEYYLNGESWPDDIEIDFKRFKNDYSIEYVNRFASDYDIKGMTFESMQSPQFYNYSTDRIFINISEQTLKDIIRRTCPDILKTVIKERFTSYDGFASFYPNNLKEWSEHVQDWDHNQLGALLEAFQYTECQLNPEKDYLPEFYDIEIDGLEYVDNATVEYLMSIKQ